MLRITKNIEEANLVTHTSTFHPDEVFCTMLLSKVIENPVVCRTPYKLLDLDKIIDLFNKSFDEDVDNDDNFMTAVSVATLIFDRIVLKEDAIIRANKKTLEIIKEQLDKDTLILPEYMPYEDALFSVDNNFKTIIFPSNRGGYNIKIKTVSRESKELAFHFPEEYLGKHDEELEELSGIKTLRFCHSSGFLAATDTLSDALELAKRVN